jgi:chromosome segregation ATPase
VPDNTRITPRELQRLQGLDVELKAQREAAKTLTAERNALQARLARAEAELQEAQSRSRELAGSQQAVAELIRKRFEPLGLALPAGDDPVKVLDAVAAPVKDLVSRGTAAEQRIGELEAQLAEGAAALEAAAGKFRELKERADAREAAHRKELGTLTAQLTEARGRLEALQAPQEGGGTVEALLAENQRLAARMEAATADAEALRKAAGEARSEAAATVAAAEDRARAAAEVEVKELQRRATALQKQLATANAQLAQQGKVPLLSAGRVAEMLDGLVAQMQDGFGGLQIRDGELKLKVGFAGAGELGGFVIPTTDSAPELRESLQEVTFRFDRAAQIRLQEPEP